MKKKWKNDKKREKQILKKDNKKQQQEKIEKKKKRRKIDVCREEKTGKELSQEACRIFLNAASGRKRKFVSCKTLGISERGVRYMRLRRKMGEVLNTGFRLR